MQSIAGSSRKTRPPEFSSPCPLGPVISTLKSTALQPSDIRENEVFSVIFEVHPKSEQWDAYLGNAKMLRSELEQVDGFVDNIRYKSLTRDGWILSLSGWRDEKSLVRWRTQMGHHEVQELGRAKILEDYHLRVGQITEDTRLPEGRVLLEQRLDETEVGNGTTVTLIDAKRP